MLLIALHKVLGLDCSPALALDLLLPPLVMQTLLPELGALPAHGRGSAEATTSCTDGTFATYDTVTSRVHTCNGLCQCSRPLISWAEVVACTHQGQALANIWFLQSTGNILCFSGERKRTDAQRGRDLLGPCENLRGLSRLKPICVL